MSDIKGRLFPIGRYAPSPTGDLHLGNLRTAIIAHDDIRAQGGTFVLRMEDTDTPRNVSGAEASIMADLQWLGLTWDEGPDVGGSVGPYRQSEREHHYREALGRLAEQGLIYACQCSRRELQSAASAPHGSEGSVYPGTCRSTPLPEEIMDMARQLLFSPGRDHGFALRLRTDSLGEVPFMDEIHGPRQFQPEISGDFVILRRDGLWAYQFVCAVDDALMGITRVVRGDDLLSSAPRQVALISALGYDVPTYRHIPLVADSQGLRLSKRDRSSGLGLLKEQGLSPAEARALILNQPNVNP